MSPNYNRNDFNPDGSTPRRDEPFIEHSTADGLAWTVNPPNPTQQGVQTRTNVLAILALIFAFFIPIVGIILGIVSLVSLKKGKESGGKGLSIAGVTVGALLLIAQIFSIGFVVSNVIERLESQNNTAIAYNQPTEDEGQGAKPATSDVSVEDKESTPTTEETEATGDKLTGSTSVYSLSVDNLGGKYQLISKEESQGAILAVASDDIAVSVTSTLMTYDEVVKYLTTSNGVEVLRKGTTADNLEYSVIELNKMGYYIVDNPEVYLVGVAPVDVAKSFTDVSKDADMLINTLKIKEN